MKQQQLENALRSAAKLCDLNERDTAYILSTIKMDEEAQDHLNCKNALGYFSTEGTVMSRAYYDYPSYLDKFITAVNAGLGGAYIEPYNHIEYLIYPR